MNTSMVASPPDVHRHQTTASAQKKISQCPHWQQLGQPCPPNTSLVCLGCMQARQASAAAALPLPNTCPSHLFSPSTHHFRPYSAMLRSLMAV